MSIDLIKNYKSDIEQEVFDKKRILDAYDKIWDSNNYRRIIEIRNNTYYNRTVKEDAICLWRLRKWQVYLRKMVLWN